MWTHTHNQRDGLLQTRAPSLLSALGGVVMAAGSLLSPAPLVQAQAGREPDARLQIIIHSIKILDDQDFIGDGEFEFTVQLSRKAPECDDIVARKGQCKIIAESENIKFSADSGETIQVRHTFPDAWAVVHSGNPDVGLETGLPVWREETYWFKIEGWERDGAPTADEYAGLLIGDLTEANNWGIGTWTERALNYDYNKQVPTEVTYEIRRIPLPDLQLGLLSIAEPTPTNPNHSICVDVRNTGAHLAPSYQLVYRLNGEVLPNGIVPVHAALAAGSSRNVCAWVPLPASGNHALRVTVDEARAVPELYEHNNHYEASYVGKAPATTPTPTPAAGPPDLTVEAIKVLAYEQKSDCDPGKNIVTITLKNGGGKAAGPFKVQLEVDGDDKDEESLPGLDAGKTIDVTFDKVKLKKGDRSLEATADSKQQVSESNETNNSRTVTVSCRDERDVA